MKLGWLCWGEFDTHPTLYEEEPESYLFVRIVPIVYAEVVK